MGFQSLESNADSAALIKVRHKLGDFLRDSYAAIAPYYLWASGATVAVIWASAVAHSLLPSRQNMGSRN